MGAKRHKVCGRWGGQAGGCLPEARTTCSSLPHTLVRHNQQVSYLLLLNILVACLPQAGDQLLLDVAPQFWTAAGVSDTFQDIVKGGQVGVQLLQDVITCPKAVCIQDIVKGGQVRIGWW